MARGRGRPPRKPMALTMQHSTDRKVNDVDPNRMLMSKRTATIMQKGSNNSQLGLPKNH